MRRVVAVALLAAACSTEEGPLMAPGQDCLRCHDGGEAKRWTAAGTWTRGAQVTVTDARGKMVPMTGNKVGNFYTAEPLVPPLTVTVDGVEMNTNPAASSELKTTRWPSATLNYGGCNLCHAGPSRPTAANLEFMAPGRDCLRCHDGGTAARFYAAGTFPPAGRTVVITDRNGATVTRTTNAAGNFWVDVPLALPLQRATVDGEEMPLEKGLSPSCNACHGENGEADDD